MSLGIASTYAELKGQGLEYLVIDGYVVAKFYNGDLLTTVSNQGDNEETITAVS